MPGLGRKKAVETTEDEGPLAPSSVKLSAFNLSVEEKAERNRMSQELDEPEYRKWLAGRKKEYKDKLAAAEKDAAKEEVEEQRQYALRVTADKGEELMATRATYKSEWDNAAESRRDAYAQIMKWHKEYKADKEALAVAAALRQKQEMDQGSIAQQNKQKAAAKAKDAEIEGKIDEHLRRIKLIDADAEQRFIAMNIAVERMELAQVDEDMYAVPMGKEAEWSADEIVENGELFDISYYIQINTDKLQFPAAMAQRRNLQLEAQILWNAGNKSKPNSKAADMTKEVTDVQRIFSELELEVQRLHEITNGPNSVSKRTMKIEGYRKDSMKKQSGAK